MLATAPELTTWTVYGGWRVMWAWWVWDYRYGWEQEHEPCSDLTIYPTREEAEAAIALRRRTAA